MTRLCLVRHGQTDWNIEGRYQGQSDVPLNETGRAQARALAEKLAGQTFSAIYASDLGRTRETAGILAACLRLPVQFDARLREINQGEWEGQLVQIIQARYSALWSQRAIDPASLRPPGGETVGEVARRVYAALNDITRLYPAGPVLIAAHGISLAVIICKDRGIPLGKVYGMIPANAAPVWVEWKSAR